MFSSRELIQSKSESCHNVSSHWQGPYARLIGNNKNIESSNPREGMHTMVFIVIYLWMLPTNPLSAVLAEPTLKALQGYRMI